MNNAFRKNVLALCAGIFLASTPLAFAAEKIKIGFLVKMPEQGWFISEQRSATETAKKLGFEVINMGTPDADKVLAAIDSLAAQGAKGFVICAPDVKLGSMIAARAKKYGMKVVSVDDRLVDESGNPIAGIPHVGMSGYKIGQQVGRSIAEEVRRRGWNKDEVGILRISNDELPTAKDRTDGATAALLAAGMKRTKLYSSPSKSTDHDGGFNAATATLTQQSAIKHWVIYALNDETVLGAVRASEHLKLDPKNVVAVGINGAAEAFAELGKPQPTGFYGSIAVSSAMHGYVSSANLFYWLSLDRKPPADTQTSGKLMVRDNWPMLKMEMGL